MNSGLRHGEESAFLSFNKKTTFIVVGDKRIFDEKCFHRLLVWVMCFSCISNCRKVYVLILSAFCCHEILLLMVHTQCNYFYFQVCVWNRFKPTYTHRPIIPNVRYLELLYFYWERLLLLSEMIVVKNNFIFFYELIIHNFCKYKLHF